MNPSIFFILRVDKLEDYLAGTPYVRHQDDEFLSIDLDFSWPSTLDQICYGIYQKIYTAFLSRSTLGTRKCDVSTLIPYFAGDIQNKRDLTSVENIEFEPYFIRDVSCFSAVKSFNSK